MDFVVVCLVALVASALTLYSGFGLGTLLLPAFAFFFPVPVAVAATAVVHLSNNLFKTALVGRHADRGVVLRFAPAAAIAAIAGAALLGVASTASNVTTYHLGGREHDVTAVKLLVGSLIIVFALLELSPWLDGLRVNRRYLPVGGLLSGFFGGLTGAQGALRGAFLLKSGLGKEAYVGTSVVVAIVVDLSRIPVYAVSLAGLDVTERAGMWPLVAAATVSAFAGAFLGSRYLGKVTMRGVQLAVGVMLVLVGAGIASALL